MSPPMLCLLSPVSNLFGLFLAQASSVGMNDGGMLLVMSASASHVENLLSPPSMRTTVRQLL